ncbi:Rxlr effector protein, partial [Globisporangium splendens]
METRITTAKEERRLRQYWNRIWGITNLDEATSFWSIHPDATGGVAILTNPKTISETQLIEESKWTNRTVAIKSKGVVWINVYAPNKKSEREHFFRRLNEEFGTHRAAAVLGGDFNCVLDKQRDRTEKISDGVEHTRRTGASGGSGVASAARTDGAFHILEKKLSQSTRPILYSRESGKRRAMGGHRATQALLGSPSSGAAYEMDEPTAETKEGEQVQAISRELELMQSEGPIEWSHLEKRIIQAILRVSRAEKRQVRRYQQKLEDQQHQPVKRSRRQLIEEQANAAREAAEFKFGKYMQATQGDVRHFFRRIANWQRDQTISRLEPTPGRYHPPNVSLADVMGAEWHQITGQSHATVPPHKAGQRFDALVYIPETRKVTEAQNQDLMAPITEKEVREAITALHRNKAGGVDSLSNDFYKDCEDAMVDVLVREFNNIQRGAPMPRSFGQGIVIPLRKKGDSPNPLDYRPITLLTTTYKLFAKVLATRLQDILLWIIGEEQQGFVRDRLMENAILIMQAALDKAYHSSTEGFDDAPGIVMLDFMKAYDTLDRDFLYLVLSKFGFGRQFVDLVRRMHTDTTAQYLVNGELSREWEVKSGIRQGCPLAPLLFIVAAEILALAVQQDPYLEGIRVTKSGAEPHLISTFVDDSAVFLKQGRQLPRLMQLLTEFGQQSGLHVQPTKSSYISLNTAVVQEQRCGIPILKHGETVRYLGIQIGTGNITQANWEDRLQKLRTRLIIATKVSNSVVGRVLILNSVLLPSILFTAGYIKPPAKVVDQLVNLQKQFLWKSTLGTDGMRHKVSPSLLYLPVKEGGSSGQKSNWGCCAISPKERSQHAQTRLYQTNNIHRLGWEYLGEDLVAAEGRNPAWKDDLKRQMESLLPTVDLEWRSDGRVGVYFGRKPEQTIHQLSEETRAFWPSFQWNDNPWIIDSQGEQYTVKTVSFLKECNLASFNVRREEERVFSVRLPTMTATLTSKRRAVLRKLVTSIILCSPEMEIDAGSQLIRHQEPWSRKHTKREYKWISNGMGTIIAVPGSERSHTDYIQMQRQANGVLWTVTDWTGDATCQQDVAMIEEEIKTVGWTFKPHPLTTHCPWLVHERTPPNSIQKTIDRARTRRLHSKLYQGLGVLVDKLNEVAKTDQWYSHVQYRLPADLWKQRGCLTPYQMWTTYRISAMQLNLFHPGRIESSACPSNAGCGETKETISHIVWSCKRAQAAWMAFLGRWIGRTLTEQALNLFLPHIASRTAPPGQRSLLRELEKSFGFITPEHSTALQKLWFIVTSSIPVLLWRTRVEIVHERQHVAIEESTKRVWTACVMQVRAVAHRMRTLKGEKINATCLSQLLSVLERQDLSRQLEAWATARLYFDGGARGNPGPGGSGWALIFLNERSNRWELKACGYAYMGPEVTNNWCEYSALKDGLAYSAHYLQHYEVKLEVFGDSQMIIAAQNGFASIRQTELQPLAVRVNQIIANFAWISWNHTKREQNKMADLLANVAMNSKSAKILTDESRGNDQILMSQVAVLLDNDIGATPSKLRNTSLAPSNAINWSKCIQALRVRLRLARLKTHSVAQRAAIASAVIIPKVLYVARHSWPSMAIVNQLHDLVKQFVWGSRNGLSVPNIRTELMTMSATAVSKWAITTSHIAQVIGEILLHNTRTSSTYITPLDAIPRRPPQLRDNMWTTGAALCASLHSRPYEPRERGNVRWCYEHFKSTIVQTQWDGDVFQINLSSKMSDRLPGIIAEGRKLRGTFCAEWLPYMTSTADGWLLDSNGSPYKLAHTSLSVGTAQLGDILRWEWIRPGVLNLIPTCGISGFSRPSIRALERLCATLVSNFPQLLYRPQQTNVLRLYNGRRHYNHEWHLHTSEATLTHVDTTLVKATHTVHSAMDCGIMATRDLNGQKEKADLSCSNPERSQVVQSSVQHLFWECPKAKLVWNYFYVLWAKIGITPGHDPAIWIFSLDLPDTPRQAWTTIKRHIIGHKCSNEHLQDHLYPVAHMLWRYMSASLIQAIWCAHLRRMDSDRIESTAEMAIMITRLEAGMRNLTRLAEAQAGDSDGHTVAAVLKAYVDCFLSQTDAIPLTPSDTRGVYLLFSMVDHATIQDQEGLDPLSMAYSRKDTTNNFAEYWGLIHGLREAQRSHFEPLYVIGDSALIISQQRMHRSPRQHRLARLYQTSRRLADCIDIRGWYLHYRAFNKMADSAANLAMDTRTSMQVHFPTQRAAFNNLTQDLDNDVMHWLVRSSEDPRSLDNTRQPHIGPREHAIMVKDYLAFRSDLLQSAL